MAPGSRLDTTEIKFRINKAFVERINKYRHLHEFSHRKDAIVDLLTKALDIEEAKLETAKHENGSDAMTKEGQDV